MNNRHKVMTKKLEDISKQLLESEGAALEAIEEELTATLNSIVGSDVSEEVEEYYRFEEEKEPLQIIKYLQMKMGIIIRFYQLQYAVDLMETGINLVF